MCYKKQQLISINFGLSKKVFVIGYWRNIGDGAQNSNLSSLIYYLYIYLYFLFIFFFLFFRQIYTTRNKYKNCAKISKIYIYIIIITLIFTIKNREELSNEKS